MALPTIADLVAKARNADRVVGILEEAIQDFPELRYIPARGVEKDVYTYVKRTGLPTGGGFRNVNDGVTPGSSTYTEVTVTLKLLSELVVVDKAVALAHVDGPEAYMMAEATGAMSAFLHKLLSQFYYGTSNDANGFTGLGNVVDSSMVVNAGGTAANTGSSVWALALNDPRGVCIAFKSDRNINPVEFPDPVEQLVPGATAGTYFPALVSELTAWVGLQPGHKYQIGKIKNITEDSGHTLNDDLMADLYNKFPEGSKPTVFIMTRRSRAQLQKSRTAYNPLGMPAAIPTEWEGIPIVVSEVLRNNEAIN